MKNRKHENCAHYQFVEGTRMVEVDKDDWFDYCTDDEDENPND